LPENTQSQDQAQYTADNKSPDDEHTNTGRFKRNPYPETHFSCVINRKEECQQYHAGKDQKRDKAKQPFHLYLPIKKRQLLLTKAAVFNCYRIYSGEFNCANMLLLTLSLNSFPGLK